MPRRAPRSRQNKFGSPRPLKLRTHDIAREPDDRHDMRLARLHPACRYLPARSTGIVEVVEFAQRGAGNLARSLADQHQHAQRGARARHDIDPAKRMPQRSKLAVGENSRPAVALDRRPFELGHRVVREQVVVERPGEQFRQERPQPVGLNWRAFGDSKQQLDRIPTRDRSGRVRPNAAGHRRPASAGRPARRPWSILRSG